MRKYHPPHFTEGGLNEHLLRMPFTASVNLPDGTPAHQKLSPFSTQDEMLKSTSALHASFINMEIENKDEVVFDYMMATRICFIPYALKDTREASFQMRRLIRCVFEAASAYDMQDLRKKEASIVTTLAQEATSSRDESTSLIELIPSHRAMSLLKQIAILRPDPKIRRKLFQNSPMEIFDRFDIA